MDDCDPVIVNFSCLDDQVQVWNTLKSGSKYSNVKLTKDSRSNKEKANYIHIRKVVKRRKKSNYHKHCASGAHSDSACEHDVIDENKDFEKGERSLLLHGVPSDWVEEEMMEDDIDFIRDVLEQKILRCVESVGIKRRVEIHRSNPIIDRYFSILD